jgi:hypothetical protein
MADQKDHDLLIAINAKLTGLCKNFNDLKNDNKNAHQKIWDGINCQNDKKLPSKIFYWVMPFVILGLMGIAGLASTNRYSLGKIEKAIELHMEKSGDIEKDKDHVFTPDDFVFTPDFQENIDGEN